MTSGPADQEGDPCDRPAPPPDVEAAGAATSDSCEFPTFAASGPVSSVFVVAQDPLYRRIFARMLGAAGFDVKAFSSPSAFLSEVGPHEAGCLLFDADVGLSSDGPVPTADALEEADDLTAPELLQRLAASKSPLAAVAVTSAAAALRGAFAVPGAVSDVLERPVKREILVASVRDAVAASEVKRGRRAAARSLVRLSERQQAVLRLTAAGRSDWAIALRLFARVGEVRRLRAETLKVLGVDAIEDAVAAFHESQSGPGFQLSRRPAKSSIDAWFLQGGARPGVVGDGT